MYKIKTLNPISNMIYDYLPKDRYTVDDHINHPDAILVRSADMHTLSFDPSLLAIARAGTGVNNIPLEACTDKGIVVFNTPGANANGVAELVMAGMLLLSRNIITGAQWVQQYNNPLLPLSKAVEKEKSRFTGPELRGKTLGIIGLGAIGTLVANNAAVGFGMKVLGFDPFMTLENAWALSRNVHPSNSVEELVEQADYLTLHIPLTKETQGLVNESFIQKMKKGAYLLNFSRGELVDNKACIQGIRDGYLAGYATDFPSAELVGEDKIICIPHLGASTPQSEENCASMAAKEIQNYLEFGSIHNSVNMPQVLLSPLKKHRVLIIHNNVPNMVSNITAVVSKEGLNIDNMVNQSKEAVAVTVLDFDQAPSNQLLLCFKNIKGVKRVRSW